VEGSLVDEVIMGNVLSAGLGQNIARQIAMAARIPKEKTAFCLNMVCGSGLRAVSLAAQSICCGDARVVVAGGAENMSAAPYLVPKGRSGYRLGHGELLDDIILDGLWDKFGDVHMGLTAENIAKKYDITREMQDAFAARSQNRAEKAIAEGRFEHEIVPVMLPQKKKEPMEFRQDEFPWKGVTPESIGKLPPAFKKDGTVTAGNASGINDQAAALLVAEGEKMKELKLEPMARIVSYAWHGTDPAFMGIGPVEAVRHALAKAGWALEDVQLIEANEARKAGKGLASLCIGGGMGIAMCVERVGK
jgi:acetyl-CoA C-acetyltransferase